MSHCLIEPLNLLLVIFVTGVRMLEATSAFISGWYNHARKVPSPFFNDRPDNLITALVLHNISLPEGEFGSNHVQALFLGCLDCSLDESFADLKGLEVSAHFYIDRQGDLLQFVSTDKRAWHAGVSSFRGKNNVNDFSIGIELEGTDFIPYTDEQYLTLSRLARDIMLEYPIKEDAIIGHCDIAPDRKTDPGASFDWCRFRASLKE